jgi:hypothetical protein
MSKLTTIYTYTYRVMCRYDDVEVRSYYVAKFTVSTDMLMEEADIIDRIESSIAENSFVKIAEPRFETELIGYAEKLSSGTFVFEIDICKVSKDKYDNFV